jgi:hypothetical protein
VNGWGMGKRVLGTFKGRLRLVERGDGVMGLGGFLRACFDGGVGDDSFAS